MSIQSCVGDWGVGSFRKNLLLCDPVVSGPIAGRLTTCLVERKEVRQRGDSNHAGKGTPRLETVLPCVCTTPNGKWTRIQNFHQDKSDQHDNTQILHKCFISVVIHIFNELHFCYFPLVFTVRCKI